MATELPTSPDGWVLPYETTCFNPFKLQWYKLKNPD